MKKSILFLISLLGYSLQAMNYVPEELQEMLKLTGSLRPKPDVSLEKLKVWAAAFPSKKAFGRWYHPANRQQITLLYPLVLWYKDFPPEDIDPMIDFLLNECEADPEIGHVPPELKPLWGSLTVIPYEHVKEKNFWSKNDRYRSLLNRIEGARQRVHFEKLYSQWKRDEKTTQDVIDFLRNLNVNVNISSITLDDGRSLEADLASLNTDDAKKIRAYAAPYQKDLNTSFKNVILGIVETGIPCNDIVYTFVQRIKALPPDESQLCDIDTIPVEGAQSVSLYLYEKMQDPSTKACAEKLYAVLQSLFKEYRSGLKLPATMPRQESLGHTVTKNTVTNESLCELLLHCAEHQARHLELEQFLYQQKDHEACIDTWTIPYQGTTFDAYFKALDDNAYPHKKHVFTLLEKQKLWALAQKADQSDAAFNAFQEYFNAHPFDIDTISLRSPYTQTPEIMGKSYLPSKVNNHVNAYRSEPPFIKNFRTRIHNLLSGTSTDPQFELRLLSDPCHTFNIDLIAYDQTNQAQTIAQVLEASDKEIAKKILALEPIRKNRSAALPVAPHGFIAKGNSASNRSRLSPSSTLPPSNHSSDKKGSPQGSQTRQSQQGENRRTPWLTPRRAAVTSIVTFCAVGFIWYLSRDMRKDKATQHPEVEAE